MNPSEQAFARVRRSFERQGMLRHLGVVLLRAEPGLCELALPYGERVTQQQGSFHGGALGTLADVAGGYAALTVAPEGMEVVTVEYKINLLAARQGGELRATGRVVRAGQRVIVATAEIVHVDGEGRTTPCTLMQQTLVPVPMHY